MLNHVSAETKEALLAGPVTIQELAARAAKESMGTLDYLSVLRSVLMGALTSNSDAGDVFGLSRVASTLLNIILEMGKISGEVSKISHLSLHQTNQNVFLSDPDVPEDASCFVAGVASPSRTPGGPSSLPCGT